MLRRWLVAVLLSLAIFSTFASYKFFPIKEAIDNAAAMPEHFETVETFTVQAKKYTATVKALGVAIAMHQAQRKYRCQIPTTTMAQ